LKEENIQKVSVKKRFSNGNIMLPLKFQNMSFRKRIRYYAFSRITTWGYKKFLTISPEELGLRKP
jgi:hypothetical protein